MPTITVVDFEFSERAESKMWDHGIMFDQLYEALNHKYFVERNRRGRVADYIFIGRDEQGRCLTVPIVSTEDPLIWRPITAWRCKPSEAAKLR